MDTTSFALYFFVLILGTFIGAAIYFQKHVPQFLKFFPVLFLSTLIVEKIGFNTGMKGINNLAIYNFFFIAEYSFFFFVLKQIIQKKRVKEIIFYCQICYPVIYILSLLFITGIHVTPTVLYSIGAILIIIFSCYYFHELFNLPNKKNISRNPEFWVCIGLLTFYSCSLPILITNNILANLTRTLPDKEYFKIVNFVGNLNHGLNIIYYSTFIAAFLCKIENL